PPFPMIDGGCMANADFLDMLHSIGYTIHYYTLSTPKHPYKPEAIPKKYKNVKWYNTRVDTLPVLSDFLWSIMRNKCYKINRCFTMKVQDELSHIIDENKIQVVCMESIFLYRYMKLFVSKLLPVWVRTHNIEFELYHKHAKIQKNPFKKYLLKADARLLKK